MYAVAKGMVIAVNILICDDMKHDADNLCKLLVDSGFNHNSVMFSNAKDAFEHIRSGASVDVCFLDIIMPGKSGVELAKDLRDDGWQGFIVFLSTSKDFGPETYQVKAFSYLLKPVSCDSVREILHEIEHLQKSADTSGISVKGVGQTRFLLFREISYVEAANQNVIFRLTSGLELKMRSTFAEIAATLLEDTRFIQCHRSYVINMNDVISVCNNDFIMQSGVKIPIARSFAGAKLRYIKTISKVRFSEH